MEIKNRFGEYIAKLRKERDVSLEQLSDGLCDCSMISRFERGEREPDKLMQNRILTRLGAVPENYENFLYYDDYCRWEKRQGIIHYILEENMAEAKRLLELYCVKYDMKDALEQQFYLAMLVQIRRYEGAGTEELAACFEEALQLTVPDIDTRSFRTRALSLEELNLLLEYRYYKNKGISLQFYEALLEYIEKTERTLLAKAKIYPKTVHYYYEAWKHSSEKTKIGAEHLLQLCDAAIELLRNSNRMFYLWELFCMKEELMSLSPQELQRDEERQHSLQECHDWRIVLEELYREYGISIAMYEFCYLYVESENYCIGDVIRIRRKMLGLSQKKLCQGICDVRTLSRLEQHQKNTHKEIVQELFDRLNLSTELCRTELVTDNQEAIEKYRELRVLNNDYVNLHMEEKLDEMRNYLKDLISLDIPSNKQIILRNECINMYGVGKITAEEYIDYMKKALEYTVPYSAVISVGEKYLTNEEIGCLQNIVIEMEDIDDDLDKGITVLQKICERPRYPDNYVRMYEFIMATVSSYLGNQGEYEQSNVIKKKIISLLLRNRRIKGMHEALYGLYWNNEHIGKCAGMKTGNELEQCLQLSLLDKDVERQIMYRSKIEKEKVQK